jgi:hypothetical protein
MDMEIADYVGLGWISQSQYRCRIPDKFKLEP